MLKSCWAPWKPTFHQKHRRDHKQSNFLSILLTKLVDRIWLSRLHYCLTSLCLLSHQPGVHGGGCPSASENLPGLFVHRVPESDEPGRLNIATETSLLRCQMGNPRASGGLSAPSTADNPREETAFLLACVSLQRRDHQSNKSVMPPSFSLSIAFSVFDAFFYLQRWLFFFFFNLFRPQVDKGAPSEQKFLCPGRWQTENIDLEHITPLVSHCSGFKWDILTRWDPVNIYRVVYNNLYNTGTTQYHQSVLSNRLFPASAYFISFLLCLFAYSAMGFTCRWRRLQQ